MRIRFQIGQSYSCFFLFWFSFIFRILLYIYLANVILSSIWINSNNQNAQCTITKVSKWTWMHSIGALSCFCSSFFFSFWSVRPLLQQWTEMHRRADSEWNWIRSNGISVQCVQCSITLFLHSKLFYEFQFRCGMTFSPFFASLSLSSQTKKQLVCAMVKF